MEKLKLYVRTPLNGNEFKVCNELTDEVVAIFFNQQDAVNYATTPILPSELLKQRNELLDALQIVTEELNQQCRKQNILTFTKAEQIALEILNKYTNA